MTTKFRIAGSAFATAMLAIATVAILGGSSPSFAACPPNGAFCGGIAGFPCPSGCVCVDDPCDNCNPKRGGADCGGYCKRAPGSRADCSGGASESIADGSFGLCDPTKEPGVGENLSCFQGYTCSADGAWICINPDGTPAL